MFLRYVFLLYWSNPLPVTEVIVPEMIGSVVGVYNGKNFINVRWGVTGLFIFGSREIIRSAECHFFYFCVE